MEFDTKPTVVFDCEVCGARGLRTALNLGKQPLCDDLVSINSDRQCNEYPIEILWCEKCATAHQRFQVPKAHLFPVNYHYRARFTSNVLNGMKDLVLACESELGSISGKLVLDVGCNDGSLLNIFRSKGASTVGVEPTGAFIDASNAGHQVINAFFNSEVAENLVAKFGHPDIVTFTNVFAHVENLPEVIDALKLVLNNNSLLVIENHYLGSILEKGQFDTFYHEHPRTYSLTSFVYIAKSLERRIKNFTFPERYGGNIRVFITSPASTLEGSTDCVVDQHVEKEIQFGFLLSNMEDRVHKWRVMKRDVVNGLVQAYGPLPAKSFPGRAAILLNLLELTHEEIQAVFEKPGSMKIGYYVPGTRIPIHSDDEMPIKAPTFLNLGWHISSEISNYMKEKGFLGKLIDIYSPDEL
jgi:SAM-dependent methyltransferase